MISIIKPVFESVWKRKETRIYLGFAVIYPLVVLASSFLPASSNFMKISGNSAYLVTVAENYSLNLPSVTNLVLPILALFYLAFSVFRSEADSHIMFLYKDMNRKNILAAKIVSLLAIVLIFLAIFASLMILVSYVRLIHLDGYSASFFDEREIGITYDFIYANISFVLNSFVCILLAACFSLYSGIGLTMTLAFVYCLGGSILSIFGFGFLFPNGFSKLAYEHNLLGALGCSMIVTLIYSVFLIYFTLTYFKKMEY